MFYPEGLVDFALEESFIPKLPFFLLHRCVQKWLFVKYCPHFSFITLDIHNDKESGIWKMIVSILKVLLLNTFQKFTVGNRSFSNTAFFIDIYFHVTSYHSSEIHRRKKHTTYLFKFCQSGFKFSLLLL